MGLFSLQRLRPCATLLYLDCCSESEGTVLEAEGGAVAWLGEASSCPRVASVLLLILVHLEVASEEPLPCELLSL